MNDFEQYLCDLHVIYERQGRARLDKTHPAVKVLSKVTRGRFRACWLAKSGADYVGTLRGGRAIHLEAKMRSGSRFEARAVKPHQLAAMASHVRMGALAYVIVRGGGGDYLLRVDRGGRIVEMIGRASATWEELGPYRIPSGQTWLDVVEEEA